MRYFSNKFPEFFKQLEKNNHKEWFDENRTLYEEEVKKPFKLFVTDLIREIRAFDPEIFIEAKKAIFRINRDVRFSNDKRPYKNNVAAYIAKTNKKETFPGYYIHLDAKTIYVGGGVYSPSTAEIYKIRQEIMYNYDQYKKALTDDFIQGFGGIEGKENKVLKSPFKEAVEDMPILLKKQFYFMDTIPYSFITREDLLEHVVHKLKVSYPINQFFREALLENPSEQISL